MSKVAPTVLGLAVLLASCAPTLTAPVSGRIVNAATGQEGTVTFHLGALTPGANTAGNNTTIVIGGLNYAGRTVLLDSSTTVTVRPALGVNLGFGTNLSGNSFFGAGVGTTTQTRAGLRTGNLIARSGGDTPRTLTCTLQVDDTGRGVGDCTGSDGTRYALQF